MAFAARRQALNQRPPPAEGLTSSSWNSVAAFGRLDSIDIMSYFRKVLSFV